MIRPPVDFLPSRLRAWLLRHAYAISGAALLLVATVACGFALLEDDPLPLAIIYTVLAVYGAVTTAWTLYDANSERSAIKRRPRPDKVLMAIATANVRRESIRTAVFVCIALLGALTLAGLVNPIVGRFLVTMQELLLLANSQFDRIERKHTSALLRKATERHPS